MAEKRTHCDWFAPADCMVQLQIKLGYAIINVDLHGGVVAMHFKLSYKSYVPSYILHERDGSSYNNIIHGYTTY